MKRNIALALALVLAAAVVVGTALAARRQAAIWRQAGGPERIPVALQGASERAAWVFVRAGCRHCTTHLGALARAVAVLPDSERAQVLGRVRVVGETHAAPAGVVRCADSLRTGLGVRLSPTTWLVDADGRIVRAWRGARGRETWDEAVAFLTGRAPR